MPNFTIEAFVARTEAVSSEPVSDPMRSNNGRWIQACTAIMLTMMRRSGIVEYIDSQCEFDRDQRNLTPGEVVLVLVGVLNRRNQKIALSRIAEKYEGMNLRGIFGRDVTLDMLNDHALARGLDTLYRANRGKLLWEISRLFEADLGISSSLFHLDQTKIETFVIENRDCDPFAAKPEFGLSKSGRTDLKLYTASSISDRFFVRYLEPGDGNAADSQMDLKAVDWLLENTDPDRCVVTIDSKGANGPLLSHMDDHGLGAVVKVPLNFSDRLSDRIRRIAFNVGWKPSEKKRHYSFLDLDMETCRDETGKGRMFRIVAFRSEKMVSDHRAALIRRHLKDAEAAASELRKERFASKEEAMVRVGEVQESLSSTVYSLRWCLFPEDVRVVRTKRGRRPKNEPVEHRRQWKVLCKPVVDGTAADLAADLGAVQMLITNLPRSSVDFEDLRDGATSETVLALYLGQYRVEHTLRLLKGKVGMSQVFFKKPERENAMIFVMGLATLLRQVVDHVFKNVPGEFTSSYDMIETLETMMVRGYGDELETESGCELGYRLMDTLRRLNLDEGMVLDAIERYTPTSARNRFGQLLEHTSS